MASFWPYPCLFSLLPTVQMEIATSRDFKALETVSLAEAQLGLIPLSTKHGTYYTTYVIWGALKAWLAKTPT